MNRTNILVLVAISIALLPASLTALRANEPLAIETTLVDGEAISFGTFQSNNQKVVQNKRGIFMTHNRKRNGPYTAQQWRLSRSQDGGKTFQTVFESTDATNPPVIETDAADNIYLMHPDWVIQDIFLYRFLSAEDYNEPHRTVVGKGAAGKYSMMIDEPRGQLCYFSHSGIFHRVKLDGTLIDSRQLTKRGTTAFPEYTHLNLDPTGVLHAAWTSLNPPLHGYWGIHHAQSADGGTTWTTFTGTPLPLPIVADESGVSDRITLDDEFKPSTWLSSMRIKDGKAHFLYRADMTPARQHHVRINIATGQREVDHQDVSLKGETLAVSGLDGFFATDERKAGSPLYCIARDVRGFRIACLISRDNGTTWHDYAESEKFREGESTEFNQPYATGGCRSITADGYIIGSFTELVHGGKVWYFKIKAE